MLRIVVALLLATSSAAAQSGFFSGGYSSGVNAAEQYDLQRRAIELDALDRGNRYQQLRTQQQLDAIELQIRRQNQALEDLRTQRLIRGY